MPSFCPRCNVVMMHDEVRVGICEACQRQSGGGLTAVPPATAASSPAPSSGLHTPCEGCGASLGMQEARLGACPSCGRSIPTLIQTLFQSAERAHLGSISLSPAPSFASASSSSIPPVSTQAKWIAAGLLLMTLVSFLVPFGMFHSMRLAYAKGDTICAHAGCTAQATEHIDYGKNFDFGPSIKERSAGYCKAHIGFAPKEIVVIKRGKSLSGLIVVFFYIFGPLLIVGFLFVHFLEVLRGMKGALGKFAMFSLGTIVFANGLWYVYARWMHYGLQTSGW